MPDLCSLAADLETAVLDFELTNRSYFARSISDSGDEYFATFSERYAIELADQARGECAYFVVVDDDGSVQGRFNLRDIDTGIASLGYRVAERAAGQGLATRAVDQLCREVAPALGLTTVRAAVSTANVASQRVLLRAGFVIVGPADPGDLGGKQGSLYERRIADVRTPDGRSVQRRTGLRTPLSGWRGTRRSG